jgi:hypothetical protein
MTPEAQATLLGNFAGDMSRRPETLHGGLTQ